MAAQPATDEIDIAACATIAYSSEDPVHPIENSLDECSGPGGTRWASARPDTNYEVEETMRDRTQEVRAEVSDDGGRAYRQILVQEYNFSPHGATFQREEQRVNLHRVTHLRLTIVPNKNGSGTASLTALRLFA